MPVAVLGLSHQTAPVEVREHFAFGHHELPSALCRVVEAGMADEAVLLSTCNRSELYLMLADERRGVDELRALAASHARELPERLTPYLYFRRDRAAVEHLLRVTAGLESLILGEPQIQGQVRSAYNVAREVVSGRGAVVGAGLNRLFQTALATGGRVRSETALGMGAASVASAAVELAKKIFGSLKGRQVLVLGAGEISEATLECLRAEGVHEPVVASRTLERAARAAERWGGRAIPFDEVYTSMATADIVVGSTAAPHPVLTLEQFRRVFPRGTPRPLCIIDIAIPRDAEPALGHEPGVFLYNVDDLRQIVDSSLERRRAELPRAETIIAEGVAEFWSWYTALAVVPTIQELRGHGEALRQAELAKLSRRLTHLAPHDREAIDQMTRSLLNKLLHAPTVRLREAAGNGRGTTVLDTVRYLFELDHAETADKDH